MKTIQYSLSEIDSVAKQISQEIKNVSIVALTGSLGAGKTTLTGAVLRQLGVKEPVISPTFTYVNKYVTSDEKIIYHFDLYRLKNAQEFEQLGFFEYFDQPNSIVFIEWPEILLPLITKKVCNIAISSVDDQRRNVEIF